LNLKDSITRLNNYSYQVNLIHLNSTLYVIDKLLKIVIITSIIQCLKNTLKKNLNEMGSITTVYVFKGG